MMVSQRVISSDTLTIVITQLLSFVLDLLLEDPFTLRKQS